VYAAKCPTTSTAVIRQTEATGPDRMIAIEALSRAPVRAARSCGSAGIRGSTTSRTATQIAPATASAPIATRQPSH
jgi:hypothetical protein